MDTLETRPREFIAFLREFNVIAFAVSLVLGNAAAALINAFVKDILMPIMAPFLSRGSWQLAALQLGPISIAYGPFLAELINFLLIGLVIFFIVRKLLNVSPPDKKTVGILHSDMGK